MLNSNASNENANATRLKVLALAVVMLGIIPLIVPDLIIGGRRSSVSRYWMAAYVGLQLAVAHLLATQILSGRLRASGGKLHLDTAHETTLAAGTED